MKTSLSEIQISKSALEHNIKEFKKIIPLSAKTILVVKANAYGHGIKEVVSIAEGIVDAFQVDGIEELRDLREVTNKDAFVFGYVLDQDLEEIVDLHGVLGCYSLSTLKRLESIGKKKNKRISAHLKIDAFLGRQGIFVEDLDPILSFLKKTKFVHLESVYSHFSNIEDVENLDHAKRQYDYLVKIKEISVANGFSGLAHHISATSGILTNPHGNWEGEYVRLGIGAYGLWPSEQLQKKYSKKIHLKPVLRWVTHVAQIKKIPKNFPIGYGLTFVTKKPMTVAIVPQGYSDGYDRGLSNIGEVLIKGKRCKVLGRVAMNMFVVDVSKVKNAKLEDEVVLLGFQDKNKITTEMLAQAIGTINYEIVARLNQLIPRVIVK